MFNTNVRNEQLSVLSLLCFFSNSKKNSLPLWCLFKFSCINSLYSMSPLSNSLSQRRQLCSFGLELTFFASLPSFLSFSHLIVKNFIRIFFSKQSSLILCFDKTIQKIIICQVDAYAFASCIYVCMPHTHRKQLKASTREISRNDSRQECVCVAADRASRTIDAQDPRIFPILVVCLFEWKNILR